MKQINPVFFIKSQVKKVLALFTETPKDKDVHKVAERLGINPHKFEDVIYSALSTFLGGGKAKAKGITESDVSPEEMKAGIEVEMEHLDKSSPFAHAFAKRIVLDHEAEALDWPDPRYYTGANGLLSWEKTRKHIPDLKRVREKMKKERSLGGGRPEASFDGPQ